MSISASISNALSGLTASAAAAGVVSSNIANAQTDGYGRRELQLAARSTGQGVAMTGIQRQTDAVLLAERRRTQAEAAGANARADFLSRLETSLGSAGAGDSLTGRIATLESALITAAASPESETRLGTAVTAAADLADTLNAISGTVQDAREQADADIARQVAQLNDTLVQIGKLNSGIVMLRAQDRDSSALVDQRQQLIDSVASIVPLREVARENGQVTLYTQGGLTLLDGSSAAQLQFTATPVIVPEMTLTSGALSGISVNGRAVSTTESGPLSGGSLSALFAVRDDLAPAAQSQLDAVARDLIERFSGLDSTLATGVPGLFTDRDGGFDPADEIGLSGRITLNSAVDPERGGEVWRLRNGIAATSAEPTGDGSLLNTLLSALTASQIPASGSFTPNARSFSGLAGDLTALAAADRLIAENNVSFASAWAQSLVEQESATGIDTDAELASLLLIEQAYAANARVIQTADDMIRALLEI